MPKTRPYTREELQGLRRADLQRLCKVYDIKGANAKSQVLIDTLAKYFLSPAYNASPKPDVTRSRPRPISMSHRPLHSLPAARNPKLRLTSPHRPAVGPAARSRPDTTTTNPRPRRNNTTEQPPTGGASNASTVVAAASGPNRVDVQDKQRQDPKHSLAAPQLQPATKATVTPSAQQGRPAASRSAISAVPDSSLEAPSTQPNPSAEAVPMEPVADEPDVSGLRQEIHRLKDELAEWEHKHEAAVARMEAKLSERLEEIVQKQLGIVEEREAAVQQREQELQASWDRFRAFVSEAESRISATTAVAAPAVSIMTQKRKEAPGQEQRPLSKRPRAESPEPRTPSPTHQGRRPDNSLTPAVEEDDDMPEVPTFATTPRPPNEPSSPTTDRPEPFRSDGPHAMLTPGGGSSHTRGRVPRQLSTPHRISKAHRDLSTITESTDDIIEQPRSRAITPATSAFFGQILSQSASGPASRLLRSTTPPALSPSPSIGGDNFNYSPVPAPRSRLGSVISSGPASRPTSRAPSATRAGFNHSQGHATISSPRRDYMDVALNGLSNPNDSPSAQATPGSRTMLGTERYRDTRFGDEPLVSWSTPTADLTGPVTPSH